MSWFIAIGVAILGGGLGMLCGGLIMNACVRWYAISSFEGGSGYAVIAGALLGGILGALIGLVASRLVAAGSSPSFLMGLACAWGTILALSGIVAACARSLAHVPPTLDGHPLSLEVEIKLPAGTARPPAAMAADGKTCLTLGCSLNHVQRASEEGKLQPDAARQEDGRWIVPGSVSLFTERGRRSIDATLGGAPIAGFILPVPPRPGHAQESWSPWYPTPPPGQPAWPDSKSSIRYRVRQVVPPPPAPDPRKIEEEAFAALKPDAPLAEFLPFLSFQSDSARIRAVIQVAKARPGELAAAIRSTDTDLRDAALVAVMNLNPVPPEVLAAMVAEGEAIAAAIRETKPAAADAPRDATAAAAVQARYTRWKQAWGVAVTVSETDGLPPFRDILRAAEECQGAAPIREIADSARNTLEQAKPGPAGTTPARR